MEHLKRQGITYAEGSAASRLATNISKASIEKYAVAVAKELNFAPGDDVSTVVEMLGGKVHYFDTVDFLQEDPTIVVHGANDFDVVLPNLGNTRRDRFTLAHELGHYLLHSRQGANPMSTNRKGSNRLEWEANWFAASFLMPESEFRQMVSDESSNAHIARHFRVSESAVEVRRKSLNI